MVDVSESFKKAIKQNNREVKGYIEALYVTKDIKSLVALDCDWNWNYLSNLNQVIDNNRKGENYAFIDTDTSLSLDGTYIMPRLNENNAGMGIVSYKPFKEMTVTTNYIITSFTISQTLRHITYIWQDNIVTNYTIQGFNGGELVFELTNNNSNLNMIVDLKEEYTLTSIKLIVNDVEEEEKRIRLMEIDFGISSIYEGNSLISFEIKDQIKKFVEDVPTNECVVNLNNYDGRFDILNPDGITKYLTPNAIIRPFIGVLTEDNGVEYCKMGEFYINDFSNNNDRTTTLTCNNIMAIIKQLPLISKVAELETGKYMDSSMSDAELVDYLETNYNLNVLLLNGNNIGIATYTTNYDKLIDFLQEATLIKRLILHANRNNQLVLRSIDKTLKTDISRNDLKERITYVRVDKLDCVDMTRDKTTVSILETPNSVEQNIVLSKSPDYFKISTGSLSGMNSELVISQTGGTSIQLLEAGTQMIFVKIEGEVGSTVKVTLSNIKTKYDYSDTTITVAKGDSSSKKMSIKSNLLLLPSSFEVGNYILQNASGYNVNFEYNGDPSIESGDYISVETEYGKVNLFVEDNYIKYDGGLSGRIGGVE